MFRPSDVLDDLGIIVTLEAMLFWSAWTRVFSVPCPRCSSYLLPVSLASSRI